MQPIRPIILLFLLVHLSADQAGSETLSLAESGSGGILSSHCPEFCACKWKKGKETITCGLEAKFKEIPKIKDPGTQVTKAEKKAEAEDFVE